MRRRHIVVRMTTLMTAVFLSTALVGCTANQQPAENPQPQDHETGTISIFVPSDGLDISQHTPLNTWQALTSELSSALKEQGFAADDIHTHASDGLDQQSRTIQDYVVDALTPDKGEPKASEITLVVAPAAQPDDSTSQYGNYAGEQIDLPDDTGDTDDANDANDANDSEQTDEQYHWEQAVRRMSTTLDLAKEAGMHVILVSNTIEGFTPDAYVTLSDAERIGAVQASKLVDKLKLDTVSVDNPKSIELLLPCSSALAEESNDNGSNSTGSDTDTTISATVTDDFAAAAFRGAWDVLAPYFQAGKAFSPSGLLTADTTDADWRNVAFVADSDDAVAVELTERLHMEDSDSHTRIDGIIAMNDAVASAVTNQLSALKYVGSSADVNPSITISGIVGNITGRKDLVKQQVPDPIKAPENLPDADSNEQDIESINSRWPIVTGYGAYRDVIPQIVDGQQWMTALADRKGTVKGIAKICKRLDANKSLEGMKHVAMTTMNDAQVPTFSLPLIAVSADNLKDALIDPGYISLADAGL